MNKNLTALTPPMGWNSWDSYGAGVTEKELLQNMDYMAAHLKQYGYEYIVCDIEWYEPTADSNEYHPFADLCMDEYGRLLPAENRFPSAAGGKGFRPLCQRAHDLGLKFGIHIMRGIPRQAVTQNVTIKSTDYKARDIAHPYSICCWNTDMYGLDSTKAGAQAYYDSIFELYASWGVDFVKVDDTSAKYAIPSDESTITYGGDEIELIRTAIDRCGRPMVLSLSPGPAPIEQAEHLAANANMWRITNDLWDKWPDVLAMFDRCKTWCDVTRPGSWPDCDMLPFGHIGLRSPENAPLGRHTRLTDAEVRTVMTLWCMVRSPLIIGGELTDPILLKIHATGIGAREVFRDDRQIVWHQADPEENEYYAVFNISDEAAFCGIPGEETCLLEAHDAKVIMKEKMSSV